MDAEGNLYGTTTAGGTFDKGTVFVLSPGGQERVLHSFIKLKDGTSPYAGLVMDAKGNLYGTTATGGKNGDGTVFVVSPRGKEKILHSFGPGDGTTPYGGLIMDAAGNLYGTTFGSGFEGGTVFVLSSSGKENILYRFLGKADGKHPAAGLVMDTAGNLYGATQQGGAYSSGTVFALSSSGTEKVLHSFGGSSDDGFSPTAPLIIDKAGNLYGTTFSGGDYATTNCQTSGCGTVFTLTP